MNKYIVFVLIMLSLILIGCKSDKDPCSNGSNTINEVNTNYVPWWAK